MYEYNQQATVYAVQQLLNGFHVDDGDRERLQALAVQILGYNAINAILEKLEEYNKDIETYHLETLKDDELYNDKPCKTANDVLTRLNEVELTQSEDLAYIAGKIQALTVLLDSVAPAEYAKLIETMSHE